MSTPEDVRHEIHQVKLKIADVEAKIEHLKQLHPANQRLPGVEEQLLQLLKQEDLLLEHLEHLAELRNGALQARKGLARAWHGMRLVTILMVRHNQEALVFCCCTSAAEPALNLLHWGYKSASIDSSSSTSHKRRYKGDCELVWLDLGPFCNIAKAKLHAVTSGVTIPAREAMRIRRDAAGVVQLGVQHMLQQSALTIGHLTKTNFTLCTIVLQGNSAGKGLEGRKQSKRSLEEWMAPVTVLGDCLALLQLPNVMAKQYINLAKMRSAVANALMQACSYCQEKGWRFTFVTCYRYTFFVWRVEEDRYAVTDGFLHDVAAYGLYTRELLACEFKEQWTRHGYIIWMSLEAPWGSQLPPGQLRDLEKPTDALGAAQQRDQPFAWAPAEGAPEYPLTALRLSDIRMGAGQCGPVVQGWLWGVPAAVKATDVCKAPDIVELLWHEAQIYEVLRDLQGHLLPVMHGCGYWGGRNTFFLATAVVPGLPMSPCTDVVADQDLAQAARQALQAIHQRGVAHGDVRADNILVQHCGNTPQVNSGAAVIFIDFGQAYLHPTPEECQRELADLEAELDEL
ncbi:hypothetical protein QJQ45_025149 [Haematococcus lacustris]|nr:hypothetical protein QJQ45_025149 [Haematococcus lacustris]